jgi:hypothetical protein
MSRWDLNPSGWLWPLANSLERDLQSGPRTLLRQAKAKPLGLGVDVASRIEVDVSLQIEKSGVARLVKLPDGTE